MEISKTYLGNKLITKQYLGKHEITDELFGVMYSIIALNLLKHIEKSVVTYVDTNLPVTNSKNIFLGINQSSVTDNTDVYLVNTDTLSINLTHSLISTVDDLNINLISTRYIQQLILSLLLATNEDIHVSNIHTNATELNYVNIDSAIQESAELLPIITRRTIQYLNQVIRSNVNTFVVPNTTSSDEIVELIGESIILQSNSNVHPSSISYIDDSLILPNIAIQSDFTALAHIVEYITTPLIKHNVDAQVSEFVIANLLEIQIQDLNIVSLPTLLQASSDIYTNNASIATYDILLSAKSIQATDETFTDLIGYTGSSIQCDTVSQVSDFVVADAITPSKDYQYIEWIGVSGTQWICSNYCPTGLEPAKIEVRAMCGTGQNIIFGTRASPSNGMNTLLFVMRNNSVGSYYIWGMFNAGSSSAFGVCDDQWHDIVINYDNNQGKSSVTVDNTDVHVVSTRSRSTDYNHNLGIFARNDYDIPVSNPAFISSEGKIAYLRFYESTDLVNPVHDYRPCYRTSDNVIGLHDIVTDDFLINVGTGTLLMGDPIISPSEYH